MTARRVAVVTGAAGAIGSATVQAFMTAGYHVVGVDRDPRVDEVGTNAYTGVQLDVRDGEALAGAADRLSSLGTLSHVIGIAGGALPEEPQTQHDLAALPADVFRASLDLNLTSQFLVLQAFLGWLRDSDGDRSVVLTSSFNALSGQGMPAYSAAKAGLIGMMYALTAPLGADGIRINVVAPGTVVTPRTQRIWGDVPGHFERLQSGTALGRLAVPDDVARTFLSLADDLSHVTGQVIVVDGGQLTVRR